MAIKPLHSNALYGFIFMVFFCVVIYILRDTLAPFVTGAIFAYMFQPAITRLSRFKLNRSFATLCVLILIFLSIALIFAIITPLFADDLARLIKELPNLFAAAQERLEVFLLETTGTSLPDHFAGLKDKLQENSGLALSAASVTAGKLISGGAAIMSIVSFCVIVPIVSFYLGRDWPKFTEGFFGLIPKGYRQTTRDLCTEFDRILASFFRGQAIVCLFLAVFYTVALMIAGLNYALVIGIVTGVLSFIPFVGSLFGLVASVGLAFYQGDTYTFPLIIAAIFFAGQFLEGNVLSPKILGESTGLHALWIIFALMAGGALFGFVGILLAVPCGALIGVLVRFAIAQYRESTLYQGTTA